jgi:hypothetical protein
MSAPDSASRQPKIPLALGASTDVAQGLRDLLCRLSGSGAAQGKPASSTHRTTNWAACDSAFGQRGSSLVWFDPEVEWLAVARTPRPRDCREHCAGAGCMGLIRSRGPEGVASGVWALSHLRGGCVRWAATRVGTRRSGLVAAWSWGQVASGPPDPGPRGAAWRAAPRWRGWCARSGARLWGRPRPRPRDPRLRRQAGAAAGCCGPQGPISSASSASGASGAASPASASWARWRGRRAGVAALRPVAETRSRGMAHQRSDAGLHERCRGRRR